MTNEASVEKRTVLAQMYLTTCRNGVIRLTGPISRTGNLEEEIWWRRTTNTDVSNGVTRLSLAVLGDEQKERKDMTRQSGLYKIFESG